MKKSLKHLSTALPVTGRAVALRREFNESLIKSIRYLIDVCVEVIPSDVFSQVIQKLDSLEPEMKLSGLLGVIHEDLLNAIEEENVEKVNQIGLRLCEDNYHVQQAKIISFSSLNTYYSPLLRDKFSQITRKVSFDVLSSEEFGKAKTVIEKAIKLYKESFSDFFNEFEELVSEIILLKAEGIKAGSSFDTFGMIHKNFLFNSEKITDAFDFIVHEQSHLYVYLLNKDDPIVLNPHEMYDAPLRDEKRPLMGIYHAIFVISRIQHVLRDALASNVIPDEERAYCEERIEYFKNRFRLGFDILQQHAQMTPLGEALIRSANELV